MSNHVHRSLMYNNLIIRYKILCCIKLIIICLLLFMKYLTTYFTVYNSPVTYLPITMYFCVLINLSTHRCVFNKNGLLYFTPCIYSIFIFTIMSSFHLWAYKWAYKDLQLLLQVMTPARQLFW